MGIGMGGNVKTSGELIALKILKKNFDPPYTIFDVGANKGQYCNMVLNYLSNDDFVKLEEDLDHGGPVLQNLVKGLKKD